jgi:hypothetical protein
MNFGFKKIYFRKQFNKSPFLSNLLNKRIESELKIEETKLQLLIDEIKNKYSFDRNYLLFNQPISELLPPLLSNKSNRNNLTKKNHNFYMKNNFDYKKQINKSYSTSRLKNTYDNILMNVKSLFKAEEKIIMNKKKIKKLYGNTNSTINNLII